MALEGHVSEYNTSTAADNPRHALVPGRYHLVPGAPPSRQGAGIFTRPTARRTWTCTAVASLSVLAQPNGTRQDVRETSPPPRRTQACLPILDLLFSVLVIVDRQISFFTILCACPCCLRSSQPDVAGTGDHATKCKRACPTFQAVHLLLRSPGLPGQAWHLQL